jgi:hypothetical protein
MPTKAELDESAQAALEAEVRRLHRALGQAEIDLPEVQKRLITNARPHRSEQSVEALKRAEAEWQRVLSKSRTRALMIISGAVMVSAGRGKNPTFETVSLLGVERSPLSLGRASASPSVKRSFRAATVCTRDGLTLLDTSNLIRCYQVILS